MSPQLRHGGQAVPQVMELLSHHLCFIRVLDEASAANQASNIKSAVKRMNCWLAINQSINQSLQCHAALVQKTVVGIVVTQSVKDSRRSDHYLPQATQEQLLNPQQRMIRRLTFIRFSASAYYRIDLNPS